MKAQEVVIVNEAGPLEEDSEMKDAPDVIETEKSLLLSLPAEVLQLVLFHADTGALLTSLTSCKTVFDAAQAKHVLLQHLNRMPGLRLGLNDLDTSTLFDIFRQRAAKGIYAAGVLADITKYSPCDDCVTMKRSALIPGKPTLLATAHEHGQVRIYELTEKHVRQKAELRTQEQWDSVLQRRYQMEILKMAFSNERDLAVLCRPKQPKIEPTPFADDDDDDDDEPPPIRKHTLKLVTFHRCYAKTKGHFYASDQQEIRDISFVPHAEPVGLALASKGNACITWRSPAQTDLTTVCLYGRDSKLMEAQDYDPSPPFLTYTDPTPRSNDTVPARLIFTPSFSASDRVLNFHIPGSPIHNWYTNSTTPTSSTSGPIHTNTAYLTLSPLPSPNSSNPSTPTLPPVPAYTFKIAIPFHGHHTPSISVPYTAAPMCRTSYLALGECTDPDYPTAGSTIFICQAETDTAPALCSHAPNLDAGRRNSTWSALALLSGWNHRLHGSSSSSLGTVLAVSPSATRIAAATWETVLVWSFDPVMVHQGSLGTYFPACDWNRRREVGRLRPVRLRAGGVVYALAWVGEGVLWGVTDGGVVRWDVGAGSRGVREEAGLDVDAVKEGAAAVAVGRAR